MGTRSIQFLSFAVLSIVAAGVVAQTAPANEADVCRLTIAPEQAVELAAMFTSDSEVADAGLFADAPSFIYAMNDGAFESQGATLVDVRDVTNCARHKNII